MRRIIYSAPARNDLLEIWDYIKDDSESAADSFINRIKDTLSRLATAPELGRPRTELHPEFRSMPVSSYVVFYRALPETVEVIRIVHGARDLSEVFKWL